LLLRKNTRVIRVDWMHLRMQRAHCFIDSLGITKRPSARVCAGNTLNLFEPAFIEELQRNFRYFRQGHHRMVAQAMANFERVKVESALPFFAR